MRHAPIEPLAAERLVGLIRQAAPDACFAAEVGTDFCQDAGWAALAARSLGEPLEVGTPGLHDDPLALCREPVTKLLVRHPAQAVEALLAVVRALAGDEVAVTHSGGPFVELSAAGVHKAFALEALCADLGVPAAQVLAFGDMPNDLPMLAWAGRGVAVANAHPRGAGRRRRGDRLERRGRGRARARAARPGRLTRSMADRSTAPTRLESERLVLREWAEADLEAVQALKSDPAVLRYTDEEPLDRAGARAWLAGVIEHNRVRPRRAWNLAIERRDGGEVVGWIGIGLPTRDVNPGEYDFGYQLIRRHWGHGYATEAVRRVLRFAFAELGAHRVFAECDPANGASARVMEKAGLRREAHFRQRERRRGQWCDALQYAALADEWTDPGAPTGAPLVRAARPDDLLAVDELYRQWEAEGVTRGLAADPPARLAERLGPYWFVAESAGRVVGFVGGDVRESEGLTVIPAGQRYLEVEDLYVRADHRSRGLGGRLLDRALREAAERGVERALVYSSNRAWERTVAFYRRHGFEMWFVRMVR